MISFRSFLLLILFFSFTSISFSQNDSDKIKIGPEDLQSAKGGKYYNFADKNKVNIEVTVLGTGAGRYLIPQGTTLFEFLLMSGGTNSNVLEEVRIVRFKSETPIMKGTEFKEYDFSTLYGDKEEVLEAKKNPILKPGDMIVLPETLAPDQTAWYYIRETIAFVGTLVSFYYLIDNIVRRNR